MMKPMHIGAFAVLATLFTGCATSSGQSATETTPGKFVTYNCDNKKTFSARFNNETNTVRIRTHDGSAELSKADRGLYRDDEGQWILTLQGGNKTELVFKGKAAYTACAAQT